jgi:hypothetical protein
MDEILFDEDEAFLYDVDFYDVSIVPELFDDDGILFCDSEY